MRENTFPGFNYKAEGLSAFIYAAGIFTIGLKDGKVIHFEPGDIKAFASWLKHHKIRQIINAPGVNPVNPLS